LPATESVVAGVVEPIPSRPLVLSQNSELEVASADAPLPKRSEPLLMLAQPVPPLATPSARASVSDPSAPKVLVAVAPKYAGPRTERSVVEALVKFARPVSVPPESGR
jgi:hypothetical protein